AIAKRFLINRRKTDFQFLKSTLTCYIILEQLFKKNGHRFSVDSRVINNDIGKAIADYRYYHFWTKLFLPKNSFELPPKVSILSWNYDSQLEISYKDIK